MLAAKTSDYPQFRIGEKIWYVKEYIENNITVFGRINERWRRRCSSSTITAIYITVTKKGFDIKYEIGDSKSYKYLLDENEIFPTKEECQEWMRNNKPKNPRFI